jgi:hypothetical protein
MWDKISRYLVDWEPEHFKIFVVVAVVVGVLLMRGWISKSKY